MPLQIIIDEPSPLASAEELLGFIKELEEWKTETTDSDTLYMLDMYIKQTNEILNARNQAD